MNEDRVSVRLASPPEDTYLLILPYHYILKK